MNKKWVGKDAARILETIGVHVPDTCRLAICEVPADHPFVLVEQMMQDGRDVKQFVTELLQHLRNLLMAATLPDVTRILDLSAEDGERLKKGGRSAFCGGADLFHREFRFAERDEMGNE